MKTRVWVLFAAVLLSMCFAASANAQSGNVYLKEEFNYTNLDQMQAAGWTFTRPAGISVGSGAVVLDGVEGDCAIHYNNHFPTGIFDWKVESKSMWLGQGHTTNGVHVSTEKHSYSFSADGYYDEFAFYRDNVKILRFGSYQETANQYFVMTMVREADTFSLYFNGELKNTYTEQDTQQSAVTSLGLVSPWRGDAKYDYYMLGEPAASLPAELPSGASSFPTGYVLVGGGIAALVVGGVVVYYFFLAGGSGASAGASAGAGGSVIQEHPISPLSGEAQTSPLTGLPGAYEPTSSYYDYALDPGLQGAYDPSSYDLEEMYSPSSYSDYASDSNLPGSYDPSPYDLGEVYSPSSYSYYDSNLPGAYDSSAYDTSNYDSAPYASEETYSPGSYPDYDSYPAGSYDTSPYDLAEMYSDYASDPNPAGSYDSSPYDLEEIYSPGSYSDYGQGSYSDYDSYPAGSYETSP